MNREDQIMANWEKVKKEFANWEKINIKFGETIDIHTDEDWDDWGEDTEMNDRNKTAKAKSFTHKEIYEKMSELVGLKKSKDQMK